MPCLVADDLLLSQPCFLLNLALGPMLRHAPRLLTFMANPRSENISGKRSQAAAVYINNPPTALDRSTLEMYQSFMAGYVRRINQSTFNVAIGGVRIGSAKYSRLAQINLKTRILTFSRYAIENVPERGRRYLVLHELAHVKEASHNRRFWQLVANYEPDYKQIGRSLELAFKQNVKEDPHKKKGKKFHSLFSGLIGQNREFGNGETQPKALHQVQEPVLVLANSQTAKEISSATTDIGIIDIHAQPLIIEPPVIFQQLSLFD